MKSSSLKSLQMHQMIKTSSYIWRTHLLLFSLHNYWLGGGWEGGWSPRPPAFLLATALYFWCIIYNKKLTNKHKEQRNFSKGCAVCVVKPVSQTKSCEFTWPDAKIEARVQGQKCLSCTIRHLPTVSSKMISHFRPKCQNWTKTDRKPTSLASRVPI